MIQWTGVYSDGVSGTASGSIVHQGPLSGLLASTSRSFEIAFGEDDEIAFLNESQAVDVIISPSIVSADDNSAPVVVDLSLSEGLVFGEGASPAHLVATIDDEDWNVATVTVDLSSLGLGIVSMNDRGLDGDQTIGDNKWTTMLSVSGLEVGEINISAQATDEWSESHTLSTIITVENQAPRILSATISPNEVIRGGATMMTIDALDYHGVASVAVDLTVYGGEEIACQKMELWMCELVLPYGMAPGVRSISVRLTDNLGATILVTKTQASEHHFQPSSTDMDLALTIKNTPPTLTMVTADALLREDLNTEQAIEIRVEDTDGILLVRADLGILKPISQTQTWVTLYDNGQGLDRVGGDGIYTATASVRSSTPLSGHEIKIQASDSYGDATQPTSFYVIVEESSEEDLLGGGDGLSITLIAIIVAIGALAAAAFVMLRQRNPPKEGSDRFGFQ